MSTHETNCPVYDPTLWIISGISTPTLAWGKLYSGIHHSCPFCGIILLIGEKPGFCCGDHGSHLDNVLPLPLLPQEYGVLLWHSDILKLSCKLNLIFSFAFMESSQTFLTYLANSMVAVQGKIYHHVHPSHENSAIWWLLYDSSMTNISNCFSYHQLVCQLPLELL